MNNIDFAWNASTCEDKRGQELAKRKGLDVDIFGRMSFAYLSGYLKSRLAITYLKVLKLKKENRDLKRLIILMRKEAQTNGND